MQIIIKHPLWTKVLLSLGIILLILGIVSHFLNKFQNFSIVPDNYMAFVLIGGVILIIPYQFYGLMEILKYRPKGD